MTEAFFRHAEASDRAQILALLERSLGGDRSARLHCWKHDDSPFGASYGRVAEIDGEVVAWRAFLRWSWHSGDQCVAAIRAVDTATDPRHRRQGLFSRLTRQLVAQAREEGIALVFNTPGPQSLPGYLKLGWRVVGRVPLLVRPIRPMRAARRLLASRTGTDSAAPSAGAGPADVLTAFAPVDELLAAEGLQPLCAEQPSDRRLSTRRTTEYLEWRYAAIPGFKYRALWTLDSGGPAALVFHAARRQGMCEIKVAEVLTTQLPGSRRAASRLLRRLAGLADADYLVACAAPRSPERAALLRAGFLPARRLGPLLTVLPIHADASLPDPSNIASWRLSLGDLEIF